jgi:glycosyltransferase involved in cell wall biosynthesis
MMNDAQLKAEVKQPTGQSQSGSLPARGEPAARVIVIRSPRQVQREGKESPVTVEFTGWLPVFKNFGNCGFHPQFAHTESPPSGYRFVRSARPSELSEPWLTWLGRQAGIGLGFTLYLLLCVFWPVRSVIHHCVRFGPRRFFRLAAVVFCRFWGMLFQGARPWPLIRFLRSRHFSSQMLLPRHNQLAFLTSVPYTYGQDAWVIEIEDSTTLFYPFVRNGQTYDLCIQKSPYFTMVKSLLESDQCRGIITHIRSTAASLPVLFSSAKIAQKTFHVPLGVKLPSRWQTHEADGPLNLLFTCSWHQDPDSFFLRGGLEVLEAFSLIHDRFPQVRLTLRCDLPRLDDCYVRMIEQGWVRVIRRYLAEEEMEDLMRQTHVFLLPSARVHIVSVLRAMSYGQVVVTSDGWGFDEYVRHNQNGLIVRGRYGKVSWLDEEAGLVREDYRLMKKADPFVVQGLVREISRIVEDPSLRRRLGGEARADVEADYNLDRWNSGLKAVFDRALARK